MGADRVDVVIIGAGLAGSATAWALARRGRSAVVLEAFWRGGTTPDRRFTLVAHGA